MKDYAQYSKASTSMSQGDGLKNAVDRIFRENKPKAVVESGTFQGKGSTAILGRAAGKHGIPESFVTFEANWFSWRLAKKNLRPFPFVKPLWGLSVGRKEAVEFIRNDEMLLNQASYPDVFVDNAADPVTFYLNEMAGKFGGNPLWSKRAPVYCRDRLFSYAGDNLLEKHLTPVRDRRPLVLLDSAGGIGWLEFTNVLAIMGERPFLLILDDIHHVKHYRSYQRIQQDGRFRMIDSDVSEGWAAAAYEG